MLLLFFQGLAFVTYLFNGITIFLKEMASDYSQNLLLSLVSHFEDWNQPEAQFKT